MRPGDRLRLMQETVREYSEASDLPHDDACRDVLATMKAKYGASPNWIAILKVILQVLELILPLLEGES